MAHVIDNNEYKGNTPLISGESEFGPFVASRTRHHFHRPECQWMKYVKGDRRVEFATHREAVISRRKPCKTCCA